MRDPRIAARFANGGNLGVLPPGSIPAADRMRVPGIPSGLPLDFYQQPPRFSPAAPQMPSDRFAPPRRPPNPVNFVPPTHEERRQHEANPDQFGHPVAGLLHSEVPGRTDQLSISVEPGSYVVPADVVSGIGQGNTQAGAGLLAQLFPQARATGGNVVPIVAAGGEYIVPPSVVAKLGKGDVKKGHGILDRMVRKIRLTVAKNMLKLPGPRRD